MQGFTSLQAANQQGWYQKDYATTKFEQGLKLLADGDGAHFRCSPRWSAQTRSRPKWRPDNVLPRPECCGEL